MNQQPANPPQQSNTIIINEAKLAAILRKWGNKSRKKTESRMSKTSKQSLDKPVIPIPSIVPFNWNYENFKWKLFSFRDLIAPADKYIHINQPQLSNKSISNDAKLAAILEKIRKYKKHDNQLRQQQQQEQLHAGRGKELNKNQMNDDNAVKSINIKRHHFRSRALSLQQSASEYENYKKRSKFNFMKRRRSSVT